MPSLGSLNLSQQLERAIDLHQRGRFAEAELAYRQVLNAESNHAKALHLFGILRFQQRHHDEALELIAAALRVEPGNAEAYYNRGNMLAQLTRCAEAIASYDQALTIRPDYAEAHLNRGNSLWELERFDEAVDSCDKAIEYKQDYAEAFDSRGSALRALMRHEEAVHSFDAALAIQPTFVGALLNRGYALLELHRFDEALASFARVLVIQPDHAVAHWGEANCRLLVGDFGRGWEELERRWQGEGWQRSFKRTFMQPLWEGGTDIFGKTILISHEGGFGDTIQFCRYVKLVAEMGAHVILEVPTQLKKLLSQIPGAHVVLAFGEPLPPFDYYCPIMSLPRAFKTRLDTIPAPIPYLQAPPDRVAHWETRLPKANCLRIGLVWSVSRASKFSDQYMRGLAFNRLAPLLSVDDISFVSLHRERDLSSEDASAVANCVRVVDFGHEQPDFVDTAAIISSLDLVISVDTALAHLAGALGVPVWIILPFSPDWRWLLGRSDSPWYPNARLFRQPRLGDWDNVIAEVATELARAKETRACCEGTDYPKFGRRTMRA